MRPVADAKCSDDAKESRNRGCARLCHAVCHYRAWTLFAVALTLIPSVLADPLAVRAQNLTAKDKTLRIGVLALGPRYIPSWHCGETDYHPAPPDPSHKTKTPFILVLFLCVVGIVVDI